jgi:DNA-binding response OmpR family regulator
MAQVLVVEPDARLGRTYADALRSRHHSVRLCTSAETAIYEADQQAPDIIILELQLTKHSGIEFLYEFRSYADWRSVPVIVLSNVPPQEFARSLDGLHRRLGVQAYHYKPQTSLRTLLLAVEAALAAASASKTSTP